MIKGIFFDLKLALRMLVKYPLLTVVGGPGIAFGIAAGVGGFEIRSQFVDPALPLNEGRRIVGLRNWDIRNDRPGALNDADFSAWRDQLRRVDELGAVNLVERNLTVNGAVEAVAIAEMTASGFRVARVEPLLGRTLVDADERPGALPVAVIGHSLWQRPFGADPMVVGSSVRLGAEPTTIVGVMPEAFGFPIAHQVWTPLRRQMPGTTPDAAPLHVRTAPDVFVDRLRALAARVEPTLRVYDVMPLDRVGADQWLESQYLSRVLAVLSGAALLLSLMAIYAVVAFTVVQRTREIGTRIALGADRWQVIAAIVRRPLVQIGLGIGAGGALVILAFVGLMQSTPTFLEVGMIAAYSVLMLAVCVSACIVPIRRALRLEPSQVLRAEA